MFDNDKSYKLIMAILQKDDYDDTVEELGKNKIFVTKLCSSGGFLKKENVTIMIGVEKERVNEVMEILERMAGKRKETVYAMPTPVSGDHYIGSNMSVPLEKEVGGITVFMLDMEQIKKM